MMARSLKDFVQDSSLPHGGRSAWITTIPEYAECLEAFRSGSARLCQIRHWLTDECGYLPTEATVQRVENLRTGTQHG